MGECGPDPAGEADESGRRPEKALTFLPKFIINIR
jgi:hypothetical protein